MAKKGKRIFNADRHCGARTRQGEPCRRGKGERTGHPGQGRCYRHGGASPSKHGLYASVVSERIRERMEAIEGDDPANLTQEVVLMKALISDYLGRHQNFPEELARWDLASQSHFQTLLHSNHPAGITAAIKALRQSEASRPKERVEEPALMTMLDKLSRLVERMHRIRLAGAIPMDHFTEVVQQMTEAVIRRCSPETARLIQQDWEGIAIRQDA